MATRNPTDQSPSSLPPVSRSPHDVDVIVTSASGAGVARAAYRGGALVGHNSDESRPPSDIPVEFVDWPFLSDDPSYTDHLRVVARERPLYAVAPDAENRDFDHVIEMADELDRYASTVIVVPKDVPATAVPERFRIGIPCQKKYGPVPRPVWEYQTVDRPVHILGGSANKRQKMQEYVDVASWDSTSICRASKVCDLWNGEKWVGEGANFYTRIERSVNALVRELTPSMPDRYFRERRREVVLPDTSGNWSDDLVAEPTNREDLCLGMHEEVPHPGRGYFHRPDTVAPSEFRRRFRS